MRGDRNLGTHKQTKYYLRCTCAQRVNYICLLNMITSTYVPKPPLLGREHQEVMHTFRTTSSAGLASRADLTLVDSRLQ